MRNISSSSMLSQMSSSNSSTSPTVSSWMIFLLCERESLSLLMMVTSSSLSQNSNACCCSSIDRYFFIIISFWLLIEHESTLVYSDTFLAFIPAQGDTKKGEILMFSRQQQSILTQYDSLSRALQCLERKPPQKWFILVGFVGLTSTLKSITYFLLASLFLVISLKLYVEVNWVVTSRTTLMSSRTQWAVFSEFTYFRRSQNFQIYAVSVREVSLSKTVKRMVRESGAWGVLRCCAIILFLIWQCYRSMRKQSTSSEGLMWLLKTSISLRTVSIRWICWGRGAMRVCRTISAMLATMLPASLLLFINLNYIQLILALYCHSIFHPSRILDLGEGVVQREGTDVRDQFLLFADRRLAQDFLEEFGGFVVEDFLVEPQQLRVRVVRQVVLGPCADDQVQLPDSQVLRPEKHLIPQGGEVLLDGGVVVERDREQSASFAGESHAYNRNQTKSKYRGRATNLSLL